ncbi:MAG: DUF3999 domain-containing protein [Betaproteobacteria bacterium]|nr:DUF3999 domain-containing protein [Betaproteobacteria bacterium]
MRLTPRFFVVPLLFVVGVANGAENIAEYGYQALIETDTRATWYQASIPASVRMGAAYPDLRDLRVFNAEGESLPFALTSATAGATTDRRVVTARIFPLYDDEEAESGVSLDSGLRVSRNANGDVEIKAEATTRTTPPRPARKVLRGWLLDAGMVNFPLQRLILDWGDNNKEGFFRIRLEASDDLEKWFRFGEGQLVNLSFDGQAIRQREFDLGGRQSRYLRLLFDDPEGVVNLRSAQLSGSVTSVGSIPLAWTRPLGGEAVPGDETEYIWHLPVSLPLWKIRIVLDETNTLIPLIVYGRDFQPVPDDVLENAPVQENRRDRIRLRDVIRGKEGRSNRRRTPPSPSAEQTYWRTLASGVVYRLPGAQGDRVVNELALAEISVNQLRIRVDRRGSGFGNTAPRIELALRSQELTFLARGSPPYRLAVGRAQAQAADLPLSTLIPGDPSRARASGELVGARIQEIDLRSVAAQELAVTTALQTETAPQTQTQTQTQTGYDRNKVILWGVLILCVLLMAGMVLNLLRTRDKDAESDNS